MTDPVKRDPDSVNFPPFETEDLRSNLTTFLDSAFQDPSGATTLVGNYRWGVYAFFDYDGEPIYVGQTNERLRTRIRRHLTNQRTDAVAMSVLDPFEVFEIQVWPLPQFQESNRSDLAARQHLDALERLITERAVEHSQFKAILNEKDPPPGMLAVEAPPSFRGRIVSERVHELRSHPDFRIARRALIVCPCSTRSFAAVAFACRCMTGIPSITGNTQHWQPRMPVRISSPLVSLNDDLTRSRRLPQYGHRRMSKVLTCISS